MNRWTLFVVALAATLFRAAPTARADSPFEPALAPPTRQDRRLTPEEQALLQKYDQNGDGRLDAEEARAAHGMMQRQKQARLGIARRLYDSLLLRFDAETQGRLTPDEQAQALAFLKAERPRVYQLVIARYDRNGDGQLDAAETATLFADWSRLPSPDQ